MQSFTPQPPRWAHHFVRWFCPLSLLESVEGDLLEQFEVDYAAYGKKRADRRFVVNVLLFFRPEIVLRNKISLKLIQTSMILNYLKVAKRNLVKRKLYSFINAFGLSIGMCFCMLIYLFIQDENSFDQFHVNKQVVYRIESKSYDTWLNNSDDVYSRSAWVQTSLQPVLKEELPEVQYATRYNPSSTAIFRVDEKVFTEKITYVDKDFFSMFSFPLLAGSTDKLFNEKNEVVVTEEIAQKYFGAENALGKIVSIDHDGEKLFTVTGVIQSPPANSSVDFDILVPQENKPYYEQNLSNWGNFNTPTFVQLHKGSSLLSFKENLNKALNKHMGERLERWRKEAVTPVPDSVKMLEYEFTQLPDWHLKKEIAWEKVSDSQYSFILSGIAVLILLIACINYISLSLTTSAARKTEVGVRKVVGAQRSQLVYQFGFESLLLAFISMLFAFGLLTLFLPFFNSFTDKQILLTPQAFWQLFLVGSALTFFIGVLAGSYPSLFLSKFKPALVLKGGFTSKLKAGFTKPLVVAQFALSAFLIISSIVMFKQMEFVTTKDLGFDKDQVIVVPTQTGWNAEADEVVQRFRNRALQEPLVKSVTGTSSSFNKGYSRYGYTIKDEQKSAYVYAVDPYYVPSLNLTLVAGRNFDASIAADSSSILVNEALAKDMKWSDPLNEYLNWQEDSLGIGSKVIGVVKNYHFLSLEQDVEPMFLSMNKKAVGYLTTMLVKVEATNLNAGLDRVREIWKELNPTKPFDYSFMDDDVAKQYDSYKRWMSIMGLATTFAIIISCLGLFGLAGINAINRTKEIGIRKVMGAGVSTIFILLNKQYVWLSLIAYIIAIPFSWYVMDKWLSDFKYKITMGWELFALSVAAGLCVALLTVSYHAIKAVLINPAETLKYE